MWWWSVVSSCWQSGPPRGVSHIYSSPSSAADTWTREPTRFIGPRTSRTVRLFVFPSCSSFWLHMQVIYLVLAKSVSAVFFGSPSRKSIFVKTEARLYLSIYPSIHPSIQRMECLRDTNAISSWLRPQSVSKSVTEITWTMNNGPKRASAIQHLTITLNVWM